MSQTTLNTIGTLKVASEDNRRQIREINGVNFAFQHFVLHAKLPVGNHYHEKKAETFYFLKGGGQYLYCPVDQHGEDLGVITEETIVPGTVVHIEPYTAHAFLLESGTEMVCHSTAPFDPDDLKKYVLLP